MTDRPLVTKVIVCIRPSLDGGSYFIDGVVPPTISDAALYAMALRHRYNPEIRAVWHAYLPEMDLKVFCEALYANQEALKRLYDQGKNLAC